MNLDINHHLLRADICAISRQILDIKRVLRRTWLRPMGDEQRELCKLKRRATELQCVAAFARGKLHLPRAPRGASCDWNASEHHRRIADRLLPSYAIALEQSA
jgi:hypothetical protein